MAKLSETVKDLLKGGHIVWVATISEDGWPNISIKGSGALLDDEHVYFADIFSKKTRANLLCNKRVALGIFAPASKVAVQLKGDAELLDNGELFDRVAKQINDMQKGLPPVKYVVQIAVDSIWDMSAGPNAGEQIA